MTDPKIIELAALSTLEYEQCRKQAAKELGIERVSALDRMVRAEQRKSEDAAGFSLHEVEPWPEPVDGGDDQPIGQLGACLRLLWL